MLISLTAQRIHICTGLRFFWIRDSHSQPLVERKISLGLIVQLEVSLDSGEEAGTLSGFTAPSV